MLVAGDEFFIIPKAPSDTACPAMQESNPHLMEGSGSGSPLLPQTDCYTFSEIAADSFNLSPNTTLILLPGNHSLEHQFLVRGIDHFTIIAIDRTIVECNYGSSFVITEIQHVSITDVTFSGCNGSLLSVITETVLANCSFSDSIGTGAALQIVDTTALIKRSSFLNNHNQDASGGALYMENSTVIFSESTISNNRGYYYGGGIYSVNSTITIADGSTVSNNSAYHEQHYSSTGGGIYAVDSTVFFNKSNISSNSAQRHGAALYGINVEIYILSSSVSNHNFYTSSIVHIIVSSDSSTTSTITIYDSVFEYNTAYLGILSGIDINLLIESSNFFNNKIENYGTGGLIVTSTQFHTSSLTIKESTFERNAVHFGGGGVVHSIHTNITIVGSKFSYQYSEYAYYADGAVLSASGSRVTILQSTFSNNLSGANGGTLNLESTTANIITSVFHHNTAFGGSGGAIYANSRSDLTITECRFTQNLAVESGGALVLLNSQATIIDSIFYSNTAFEDGGAISINGYSTSSKSNLTVDNSTFSYNTATRHGGVVYASLATVMSMKLSLAATWHI